MTETIAVTVRCDTCGEAISISPGAVGDVLEEVEQFIQVHKTLAE